MKTAADYKKNLEYVDHARMWNIFRVIEHLKNNYNKEENTVRTEFEMIVVQKMRSS